MKMNVAAVLLVAVCHAALAQQAEVNDKRVERNYRKLVEGLVSPNRPIKCDNSRRTISIPPNYDWKAQERIEENRKILFEHCAEALPFLIDGCADARYSLVSKWSEDEDYYSWSVGRVCSEIVARRVEVFRHYIKFTLPMWHRYNFVPIPRSTMTKKDRKEMQEWWRGHNGMSLQELQLAGFDWAIEKRKKEIAASADAETKKAGSDELKNLVSARDKLKQSHTFLHSGVMWQSLLTTPKGYTVVPWTEKGK
jgi:hypothetical protein